MNAVEAREIQSAQPVTPPRALATERHRIVIIGGGTGGITVAARLARAGQRDLAIIEPSSQHYYQPYWTLIAGGVVRPEKAVRSEARYIPRNARWIQDWAEEIDPIRREVLLRSGQRLGYDFLVVAPGIQLDWGRIKGLHEALQTASVASIYDYALAQKMWRSISDFQGGTAVFTFPDTPVKCAGAPQKIMYLAADNFRRRGLLNKSKVIFGSAGKAIFGVKEFAAVLDNVVTRYGIEPRFNHTLVEIRPREKEAIFEVRDGGEHRLDVIGYDLLHVTPPQSAPDFIKRSPLSHKDGPQAGWVKANKYTLQHPDYPEVFALGDASALPTSRTGAAIRKQAPVLVENLLAVMAGKEPTARYDGYASCPLVTGYGKLLLAEFDYDGKPTPTVPVNTQKERYDMWLLKKYGLPRLYWNFMLRGRA